MTSPTWTTSSSRSCGWCRARRPENPAWSGAAPDPATSRSPWRVYNIGNNNPVELRRLVSVLEEALGRKAVVQLAPLQVGDVPETYADVAALMAEVDFKPSTSIETGVRRFVDWYRAWHRV